LAGAFSVGSLTGGAFNPAVATGPTILHCIVSEGTAKHLWLYWIGEILGAILASVVFRLTNTKEYRKAAAIAQIKGETDKGYIEISTEPEPEEEELLTLS